MHRPSPLRFSPRLTHPIDHALHTALTAHSGGTFAEMVAPFHDAIQETRGSCRPPPPRFHLTGYALWFRGEPLLSTGAANSMEEVLVPAAISATLGYGQPRLPPRPPSPSQSGRDPLPASSAGKKKKGLGAAAASSSLLPEAWHETADDLEGPRALHVRYTVMYSPRRAALLAAAQPSAVENAPPASGLPSFPMFGVQLPRLRPEEIDWHAPGLVAVSCRTGQGWLLTMELEPSGGGGGGESGLVLSEVVSNAQRLLCGAFSDHRLLSALAQQEGKRLLGRPISVYSASCAPLLHLVRDIRIFYYAAPSGTCIPAVAASGGVFFSSSSIPYTSGGGVPPLHCLFHFASSRRSRSVEKHRKAAVESQWHDMADPQKTMIPNDATPAQRYRPTTCTIHQATYPFPAHLAETKKMKHGQPVPPSPKKDEDCIFTVLPNPMVQWATAERVSATDVPASRTSVLVPVSSCSSSANAAASPCYRHKGHGPAEWHQGDKQVVAILDTFPSVSSSSALPPPPSSSSSSSFFSSFRRRPTPPKREEMRRDGWRDGASSAAYWEATYWRRLQPLLRRTALLASRRRGGDGNGNGSRRVKSSTTTTSPPSSQAAHLAGTRMKPILPTEGRGGLTATPVNPLADPAWPSIFSVMHLTRSSRDGAVGKGSSAAPHDAAAKTEDWVFHGIAVGARPASTFSSCASTGSTGGRRNRAYSASSSSSRGSGGVLFAILQLKSLEEQKEWLYFPEHKKHGEVVDSREFTALSQWLLSKAM